MSEAEGPAESVCLVWAGCLVWASGWVGEPLTKVGKRGVGFKGGGPGSPPWDRNPPASAGDVGSIPGPGRPHRPQSSEAAGPQLLSLSVPPQLSPHTAATDTRVPRRVLCGNQSHCDETVTHSNKARPPLATTGDSPRAATKTQCNRTEINKRRQPQVWFFAFFFFW